MASLSVETAHYFIGLLGFVQVECDDPGLAAFMADVVPTSRDWSPETLEFFQRLLSMVSIPVGAENFELAIIDIIRARAELREATLDEAVAVDAL